MSKRRGNGGSAGTSVVFWIAVVFFGFVILGMLLPVGKGQPREKSRRINCAGNLKGIGLALIIYAGDDADDGYFPDAESFTQLDTGKYLTNGKVYQCPSAHTPNTMAAQSNYLYLGAGLKDTNAQAKSVILAHDRLGNHSSWVNCLYLDGHVKGVGSKAKTWDEFRAEREAAGEILANRPSGLPEAEELPNYQEALD